MTSTVPPAVESCDGDLAWPSAGFAERAQAIYDPEVRYCAPRRGLALAGRDALLAHLLAEAAAMRAPERLPLRRTASGATRIVDESVVRFVYAGAGIAGLDAPAGARVELGRVRILDVFAGRIVAETCIETWSRLDRPDSAGPAAGHGSPPHARMAPRE